MIIAPLADVKARFSEYIKKTQDGPVVVTKNGKPVVLLLNITDEDDLERILFANSNKFQAMLDAAKAAKLPKMEQDALAEWILAELASERRWDEAFARSADLLEQLADEALAEYRSGKTQPIDWYPR